MQSYQFTVCAHSTNACVFLILSLQHYILLKEGEKNRKLNDLLDALDFNQVVIFVKSVSRAAELNKLLEECNFPSICIHSGMAQEERYAFCCLDSLSDGKSRCICAFGLNYMLSYCFYFCLSVNHFMT